MDAAAIAIALREIAARPAVLAFSQPKVIDDEVQVFVDLDLGFADRWLAVGQSPTGTWPVERVRLDFPRTFPLRAPKPSLRPDFSRAHAHFQPVATADGRPVPCIVFGDPSEFVAIRGVGGFVDQLVLWLQQAAAGTLSAGPTWEPMRRTNVVDSLACEAALIRQQLRVDHGYAFMECEYRRDVDTDEFTTRFTGKVLGKVGVDDRLQELLTARSTVGAERGLAVAIWADSLVAGEEVKDDEFRPDDVVDVVTFEAQLARFRMEVPWRKAVAHLVRDGEKQNVSGCAPFPVILLARRPKPLSDLGGSTELIGYLVQLRFPTGEMALDQVRPLACYEDVHPSVLRSLSGCDKDPQNWALLGAGSLGSKIALHRARSGANPVVIADKRWLRPHNAARHALYPSVRGWLDHKANELVTALGGFGEEPQPVQGDHVRLATILDEDAEPHAKWLVNTTGSTVAREWLTRPDSLRKSRVMEAGLFDGGDLGFVAVEGADRQPDCGELWSTLCKLALDRPEIGQGIFGDAGQPEIVAIGQGCDSATMIMSDAHLSAMAAPMAEILAGEDSDEAAKLHLLVRQGMGMAHEVHPVATWARLPLEGLEGWTLSLAPDALLEIEAEIRRWPHVETGGVLVGWHSPIAKRLFVVDVLPAPSDSKRAPDEFVLGTQDELIGALEHLAEKSAGAIYCLGTWHSHLGRSAPSDKDRASAAAIGDHEAWPMALLIRGVDGLRAVSTNQGAPSQWGLEEGA